MNLQDLKMMVHKNAMTLNCNIWKMKDQIALSHLNIIIINSSHGTATTV